MSTDTNNSDLCKLKFYNKRDRRAPLIVADFTSGTIVSGAHDKLKFECFKSNRDESISSNATRNLQASQGRLNYTGESSKTSPFNYFVGVRNKTTGRMKLYDAALFRLKPIIQHTVDSNEAQELDNKDYWDRMNDLTTNFGSKRRKRALLQKKNLTLDVTIKEIPDSPEPETQVLCYLPTVNRDASVVSQVYDMNSIIPAEIDTTLEKDAQSLQKGSDETLLKKMQFFRDFTPSQLEEANLDQVKYLVYLSYLILFQHLGYRDIQKKTLPLDIHPIVKDHIQNTFIKSSQSESGRVNRSLPQEMKDKLAAYIIIVALYLFNFKINIGEIIGKLKGIKQPKLIEIAHALGCHTDIRIRGGEKEKIIQLKIPLFVVSSKGAFSKKAH